MQQPGQSRRPSAEIIAGVAFLCLSVLAGVGSMQLGIYSISGPDPGLFPFIISLGLGAASAVWLAQLLRSTAGTQSVLPDAASLVRIGLQLLAFVLFTILMPRIGYVPSAIILVVGTAWVAGERSWLWIAVIALLASFGLDYLIALLGTDLG